MSRYIQILSISRPFELPVDENNRVMFSCNFVAMSDSPNNQWELELVAKLTSAGLATLGVNTFIGRAAIIPNGSGPFIHILNTSTVAPQQTQNGDMYEHLACQIVVRGLSYLTTQTRALNIWRTLHGIRNETITA